ASEPAQLGVAEEAVTAGLLRNEPEEAFAAQVVDPRIRRLRCGDDVFAVLVVEMSELHWLLSSRQQATGRGDRPRAPRHARQAHTPRARNARKPRPLCGLFS